MCYFFDPIFTPLVSFEVGGVPASKKHSTQHSVGVGVIILVLMFSSAV